MRVFISGLCMHLVSIENRIKGLLTIYGGMILLVLGFIFISPTVYAHVEDAVTTGFRSGFWHPLIGVDHVLAMLAVGLLGFFFTKKGIMVYPGFLYLHDDFW